MRFICFDLNEFNLESSNSVEFKKQCYVIVGFTPNLFDRRI